MPFEELFARSDILGILVFILALGIGWLILRLIFKIATRIFMFGCGAILLIGAFLAVLRYMG